MRLHCTNQEPLVFTGCLDGVVREWDLRSGQCVKEWHGHSDQILDMAVSRSVLLKPVGGLKYRVLVFYQERQCCSFSCKRWNCSSISKQSILIIISKSF